MKRRQKRATLSLEVKRKRKREMKMARKKRETKTKLKMFLPQLLLKSQHRQVVQIIPQPIFSKRLSRRRK
jgi:hypothetical protein